MALRPFVRIRLGPNDEPTSKHINLVQDNVADALAQIQGPNVLQNVRLVPSGINYINHGLGSPLQGWSVCRTHGTGTAAQVWDVQDANTPRGSRQQLYLMTSATGTFDLEIF
jgi:hypothetical protein